MTQSEQNLSVAEWTQTAPDQRVSELPKGHGLSLLTHYTAKGEMPFTVHTIDIGDGMYETNYNQDSVEFYPDRDKAIAGHLSWVRIGLAHQEQVKLIEKGATDD
jgi:hypothetical protein